MEVLAWPAVALILGLAFIFVFRSAIVRLLDRTKSVSKEGLHAYDDAQQTATTKPDASLNSLRATSVLCSLRPSKT